MIQAIIFDVGGVLIRTHDHEPRRSLEKELGLDEWESERLVFSGDDGTAAQQGTISDVELWQRIARRLDLDHDQLHAFQSAFWGGDRLDQQLVDLIRRLRQAGYQTAIISNATDNLRRLLSEEHQIADAFDLIVCSAEEKIMKPDLEIYRRTVQRLGLAPQETVFIDDVQANVEAARAVGMHAIHYREGLDVERALFQLGIDANRAANDRDTNAKSLGEKPHV